jgi:hypothetical protein
VCQQRPNDQLYWQKLGYHFKDRILTMPCYLRHPSCSRFETAVFFFLHSTYARYTSRAGSWTWKIFDKMFVATHSEAMLWRGSLACAKSVSLCVWIGMKLPSGFEFGYLFLVNIKPPGTSWIFLWYHRELVTVGLMPMS